MSHNFDHARRQLLATIASHRDLLTRRVHSTNEGDEPMNPDDVAEAQAALAAFEARLGELERSGPAGYVPPSPNRRQPAIATMPGPVEPNVGLDQGPYPGNPFGPGGAARGPVFPTTPPVPPAGLPGFGTPPGPDRLSNLMPFDAGAPFPTDATGGDPGDEVIRNWRNYAIDDLKRLLTQQQLAMLPQEALETFSNDDLLRIASEGTSDPGAFLMGFSEDRLQSFDPQVIAPFRNQVRSSGSVVSPSVTAPTTIGGITYRPPGTGETIAPSSINRPTGDWVGSPGDTGPTGNPNIPINPNVGLNQEPYPGGVVDSRIVNPTLPGGPQGPAPWDAFAGGDAMNGVNPFRPTSPVPISRLGAPPVARAPGFAIPRMGTPPAITSRDPLEMYLQGSGMAAGTPSAMSGAGGPSRLTAAVGGNIFGEGVEPNESPPDQPPAGWTTTVGDDGETYWVHTATGRWYNPATQMLQDQDGNWASTGGQLGAPPAAAGGAPSPGDYRRVQLPDGRYAIERYVQYSDGGRWETVNPEGSPPNTGPAPYGYVIGPNGQLVRDISVPAARSGGGGGTNITITNPALQPSQIDVNEARARQIDAAAQLALARAQSGVYDAQALKLLHDIAMGDVPASAELAEKVRQFNLTIEGQNANRQLEHDMAAGRVAGGNTLARDTFEATATGYYRGDPTLAREQAAAEAELAQARFMADRANQAAQIALRQGDQAEAKRQFDLSDQFRNREQTLTEEIQRGRLGLDTELGRGRLGLDERGQQLQEDKFSYERMQNPFSFMEQLYNARGRQAPPGGRQDQVLGQPPRPAPARLTTRELVDYGGTPDSIRNVFAGSVDRAPVARLSALGEPPEEQSLPYISAQSANMLLPSERALLDTVITAAGQAPADYWEQQKRLSQTTAAAPTRFGNVPGRRQPSYT